MTKGRYFITVKGKEDLKKGFWRSKSRGIIFGNINISGVAVLKILRIRQKAGATRTQIEDKLGLVPYLKGRKQFRGEKADLVRVLRSLRAKGLITYRP